MIVTVFVQNEAGSNRKHYHDEKTLEWKRVVEVSRPYPFPYGFVVGTSGEDDCNLDCFILTSQVLRTGQLVECEVLGLMEQREDGIDDHKVLAAAVGEEARIDDEVRGALVEFVTGVFAHVPGKEIAVGRFLGADPASEYVTAHRDDR